MKRIRKYLHYRRVVAQLKSEMATAFYLNYWGRWANLADRLNRLQHKPKKHLLANYQRFKRGFAADLGYPHEWDFNPGRLPSS